MGYKTGSREYVHFHVDVAPEPVEVATNRTSEGLKEHKAYPKNGKEVYTSLVRDGVEAEPSSSVEADDSGSSEDNLG